MSSRGLPWDYKDVLPVATCVPHVGDFLFDITPHAAANGRVELREVADLHSKIFCYAVPGAAPYPLSSDTWVFDTA